MMEQRRSSLWRVINEKPTNSCLDRRFDFYHNGYRQHRLPRRRLLWTKPCKLWIYLSPFHPGSCFYMRYIATHESKLGPVACCWMACLSCSFKHVSLRRRNDCTCCVPGADLRSSFYSEFNSLLPQYKKIRAQSSKGEFPLLKLEQTGLAHLRRHALSCQRIAAARTS